MTRDSDLIGFLEDYLDEHEGHTPLPDATRDAIRAVLPSIHQHPAWWPRWRSPEMNTTTKLALGVAAAALVAVVGFAVLNGGGNVGGPDPSSSDPAGTPAASASSGGVLPASGDGLAAGRYYIDVRLHTYTAAGEVERVEPDYRLTFDLPVGWSGSGFSVTKDGSLSTGLIAGAAHALYDAPCESSRGTSAYGDLPTSGGLPDYAAAMASLWNRGTDPVTSVPTPGSLAGRDARYIELTAPADLDFSDCDQQKYLLFVDPGLGQRWLQEPGQLDRVWVVDLEPGVMWLDVAMEPGATAADRAELDAIIASMAIEPVAMAVPSPSASPAAALPADGDSLAAGRYYVDARPHAYDAAGMVEPGSVTYRLTFDLPAGWTGIGAAVTKDGSATTAVTFDAPHIVYDTPCDTSGERSTLADRPEMRLPPGFAARLAAVWQGGSDPTATTRPDAVTLGGRGASYVEISTPADADFRDCHGAEFTMWEGPESGQRRSQQPGQIDLVWIVTLHPGLLLVDAALEPGASESDRAELEAIIGSIRIAVLSASAT